MNEAWQPVQGFEGYYEVSSLGNVRGLDRTVESRIRSSGNNTRKISRNQTTKYNSNGYLRVVLSKSGQIKKLLIHRLVAIAFIPNPQNKPCVNHINGIKTDNSIGNLEWCTHAENERHSFRVLGKKSQASRADVRQKISKANKGKTFTETHKKKLSKAKINNSNAVKKAVILNGNKYFRSVAEASKLTGCKQSSISNNLIGISKKTKVGTWTYDQTN